MVANAWHLMAYQLRLQSAQNLQNIWAKAHSRKRLTMLESRSKTSTGMRSVALARSVDLLFGSRKSETEPFNIHFDAYHGGMIQQMPLVKSEAIAHRLATEGLMKRLPGLMDQAGVKKGDLIEATVSINRPSMRCIVAITNQAFPAMQCWPSLPYFTCRCPNLPDTKKISLDCA